MICQYFDCSGSVDSPFIVGLTSSQYDPWADLNDDGKIDIEDIAYTAKLFGTLGDPEKNVTVTNWPVSTEVTVWWFQFLDVDEHKASARACGSASGFEELPSKPVPRHPV